MGSINILWVAYWYCFCLCLQKVMEWPYSVLLCHGIRATLSEVGVPSDALCPTEEWYGPAVSAQPDSSQGLLFIFLFHIQTLDSTMSSMISVTLGRTLTFLTPRLLTCELKMSLWRLNLGHLFRWLALSGGLQKGSLTISVLTPQGNTPYSSVSSQVSHRNVPLVLGFYCLIKASEWLAYFSAGLICLGENPRRHSQPGNPAVLPEAKQLQHKISASIRPPVGSLHIPASLLLQCWWVMCDNCLLLFCCLRR